MPRALVLLPTSSYRAGDFLDAADALGVDVVVASDQEPPFEMGDRYLRIDCNDEAAAAQAIIALGDEIGIDAIVAADDAGVLIAAEAGTAMGLLANPPNAAAATRDKLALRRLLEAAEMPQPRFAAVEPGSDPLATAEDLGYPLVIKPLDRAASQGVVRVDGPEDLGPTVARVREIVGDPVATLIMETLIEGSEHAVEGIVRQGELTVLAVFDKPDSVAGPVFPETIMITPSRLPAETRGELERVAAAAVGAIGLVHGPVHIELMATPDRVEVIEVAGRSIGGLCSRSLNFGLMGTTLETLILRNALGLDKPELRRETVASGVLMIPIPEAGRLLAVEGIEETRAIPGVRGIDISVPLGGRLAPTPVGDRYLGFVYARASDPAEVESVLRKAMSTLRVEVGPPEPQLEV